MATSLTSIFCMVGRSLKFEEQVAGMSILKRETGVYGKDWRRYPAYLLLDDAHQSYWDDTLWAAFFKSIRHETGFPFVILFSSYGSPGRDYAGFSKQKCEKIPMVFAPGQQIGMRPDESIDRDLPISIRSSESTEWHTLQPVGLLLEEDETIDLLTRYTSAVMQPRLSLSADLKKELFLITDGHAGLLLDFRTSSKPRTGKRSLVIHEPGVMFINSNINLFYRRNFMTSYGKRFRLIHRPYTSTSLANL